MVERAGIERRALPHREADLPAKDQMLREAEGRPVAASSWIERDGIGPIHECPVLQQEKSLQRGSIASVGKDREVDEQAGS